MLIHLAGLLAILTLSGCTTTLLFKLEDGRSGKPLENVTVQWSELKFFGFVDVLTTQRALPETGTNGLVEISKITRRNRSHSFGFQREGYERAAVLVDFRNTPSFGLFSPFFTKAAPVVDWVPLERGTTVIRVPLYEKR